MMQRLLLPVFVISNLLFAQGQQQLIKEPAKRAADSLCTTKECQLNELRNKLMDQLKQQSPPEPQTPSFFNGILTWLLDQKDNITRTKFLNPISPTNISNSV